ncbi:hypothetical protein BH09MYX1_BH09MYX1_59320 [soil metagenome]
MQAPFALHSRFGRMAAQAPLVTASLLAANGMAARGFRLTDVQFFFYLFGNWIERDVLASGDRLELTQIRRTLRRLSDGGAATTRGRPPRYRLTPAGVDALVATLANAVDQSSFEEAVFIATFFRCYGDAIADGASPKTRPLLDPARVVVRARRRVDRVLRDLEDRIRTSHAVAEVATRTRARGAAPRVVAEAVERAGAYQLQHVREFSSFVVALPDALRDFELGDAFSVRSALLFSTFAARARSELEAWDRFAKVLAMQRGLGAKRSSASVRDRAGE